MTSAGKRHLWVWYTPYGMGGVETYLLNMARETVRDGAELWVAATTSAEGPLRERFRQAGARLLDWSDFHDAYMNKQSAEPVRRHIIRDLAHVRPTLLALNDCNDFSLGTVPLLRKLKPYCTILDTFHIDPPTSHYLDCRGKFLDVLDGIAATNESVIGRFRRRYPEAADLETRYIANGVCVPNRERKSPGETLRLLYVGRLAQDQKRILTLPPLLEGLRARGKKFAMTIVGDGPCRQELHAELDGRGLGDNVSLAGYLTPDEVVELYFEHDVFVNLSEFEGFSMSVLEAFAAGCVPVCTDIASLDRTVFRDGVNCRLCPVDRLDGMVDIWSGLTPALLERLSAAARMTGRSLSADRTYLGYRNLLADLRSRRPLRAWPADAESALSLKWDLTKHNPWIARPHPLLKLSRSVLTRVREAAAGLRQ
jgi:glycosyltransferase involved in cell wall biosynthesis